jgi:hypothetical protein
VKTRQLQVAAVTLIVGGTITAGSGAAINVAANAQRPAAGHHHQTRNSDDGLVIGWVGLGAAGAGIAVARRYASRVMREPADLDR